MQQTVESTKKKLHDYEVFNFKLSHLIDQQAAQMLRSVDLEELKKSIIAKDSPILLEIKETTKLRKRIA